MDVSTRTVRSVLVVELTGDLDARSAPGVQGTLAELMPGSDRILLDLTGVPYISSAGLRVLLLTYRQARSSGTSIAVAGLSPELRKVLEATGFIDFLVVAEDVTTGVDELTASLS
jgi:anti-sigma B factor antagonist